VRVYTAEAADRIAQRSREVLSALTSFDADHDWVIDLRRLTGFDGGDAIAARRRIATAVVDAGRAIF
jgi:hypothetical protein